MVSPFIIASGLTRYMLPSKSLKYLYFEKKISSVYLAAFTELFDQNPSFPFGIYHQRSELHDDKSIFADKGLHVPPIGIPLCCPNTFLTDVIYALLVYFY